MTNAKSAGKAPGAADSPKTVQAMGPGSLSGRKVRLDTAHMKSSYCNVCNATTTQEEVVLNFGLNQSWDRPDEDIEIAIQHRIVMSPLAVKKFHGLVGKLLSEYEERYGPLKS